MSRLEYILMETISKPFLSHVKQPIKTHSIHTKNANVTTVSNLTGYLERLQENILHRISTNLDSAFYGLHLGDNFDTIRESMLHRVSLELTTMVREDIIHIAEDIQIWRDDIDPRCVHISFIYQPNGSLYKIAMEIHYRF